MNGELVSIVVPVYNAADYLDQCVSSILRQTYQNIEVILVNDGSTDGSEKMCERYAMDDHRVKFLSQSNQGLTRARKNGAKLAVGEYMAFVDSDDYIDSDLFQQLMSCKGNFDLIITQWNRETGSDIRRAGDKLEQGAYCSPEDMDFLIEHIVNASVSGGMVNIRSGIAPFVWNKLFKTSISRTVFAEIDENILFYEDCDFTYRYILKCSSVLITDICGYHYRIREGSLCHYFDRNCSYLRNISALYNSLEPVFSAHPKRDVLLPQLQIKISALMARASTKMGFPPEIQLQMKTPVFPFLNLLDYKRIVLYGAGIIGQNYWNQIHKWNVCEVVLWVDKQWAYYRKEGKIVSPILALLDENFDYVIIAVHETSEADEIRRGLITMGIAESKILWKMPLIV